MTQYDITVGYMGYQVYSELGVVQQTAQCQQRTLQTAQLLVLLHFLRSSFRPWGRYRIPYVGGDTVDQRLAHIRYAGGLSIDGFNVPTKDKQNYPNIYVRND